MAASEREFRLAAQDGVGLRASSRRPPGAGRGRAASRSGAAAAALGRARGCGSRRGLPTGWTGRMRMSPKRPASASSTSGSASARWMRPSRPPGFSSAAARRGPGFEQALGRRHARRGARGSGDGLHAARLVEGRVHQHPVGRVAEAGALAQLRGVGRIRRDEADARGEGGVLRAAPAPPRRRRRGRRRARRRSTESSARARGDGRRRPCRRRRRDRPHARRRRRERAPAAAPRRARRGGPCAAARA